MHVFINLLFFLLIFHFLWRALLFWGAIFVPAILVGLIGALLQFWTIPDIIPGIMTGMTYVYDFIYALFDISSDPRIDAMNGTDTWMVVNWFIWLGFPFFYYMFWLKRNWSSIKENFQG